MAAGLYTFAAADTTHQLGISYSYTSATIGKTVTLTNQYQGIATPYRLNCFDVTNGKPLGITLFAVYLNKMSWAFKADDWTEQDVDFIVAQDTASTSVSTLYVGE